MILGIFGAGSFGKELCDIAQRVNGLHKRWESIVFIDDIHEESTFYGHEVHRLNEYDDDKHSIEFIIANGTPVNRYKIFSKLKAGGFSLTNLIDPTAIVSTTATVGNGVIITPYSTISSDVVLGDNVVIQSYVRIGHDIHIEEHSVISSNVGIGGKTIVGRESYIGLGAIVQDELNIGNQSIISMGAVVYRDVPDGVIVLGNPARVMRRNETGKIFK